MLQLPEFPSLFRQHLHAHSLRRYFMLPWRTKQERREKNSERADKEVSEVCCVT